MYLKKGNIYLKSQCKSFIPGDTCNIKLLTPPKKEPPRLEKQHFFFVRITEKIYIFDLHW